MSALEQSVTSGSRSLQSPLGSPTEAASGLLSMFSLGSDDAYVMAAGIAAGLAAFAIGASFMNKGPNQAKRVKMLQERRAELRGELSKSRRRGRPESSVNFMRQVVNKFQLLKSSQVKQVQDMLNEAGWRSKDAIIIYLFFTLVLPIGLGLAGLVVMGMDFWGQGKEAVFRFIAPVLGAYIGLKLPIWAVKRRRRKRYNALQRALADTLDLMTICAEAGLTLGVSLERVSRELGLAYPEMAEELAITAMELAFLPERNKALQNWAERVKLPEIRGIVSVLIQTEKYGTPIAQAMRVLSHEFREQRMLRAEAKAAKLPAIMTIPMIIFILPTLFVIIISPAAIKIMSTMK